MTILITGSSGFIGYHLTKKLLKSKKNVIGIDNLNSYYDINLKKARLEELYKISKIEKVDFTFFREDIENYKKVETIFKTHKPKKVVNLAAQAGVRYSLENPSAYIKANLEGFGNIIELSRQYSIEHLVFASSSSVYGGNQKLPFCENDNVDHPVSLYAATKKANELIAHSYSHLYNLPVTGLRFFTVYGPWGRPDMALFLFTKAILNNEEINIYNHGKMTRDFTYIDDIVEGIYRCCFKPAFCEENRSSFFSTAPYRVFNIGNGKPIKLMNFIKILESHLGIESKKEYFGMQKGDVVETWADLEKISEWIDYKPSTSLDKGLFNFVNWYKKFYLD